MEYQMQEERKNNLTLHLLPPSPMREVHSIKLTSVVNTPLKSDAIPERIYIVPRSSGSALRRTTPLKRNSSSYISPCVCESPFFYGQYSNNNSSSSNNNNNKNSLPSNNNSHDNMSNCNSPLAANNVFVVRFEKNKKREVSNNYKLNDDNNYINSRNRKITSNDNTHTNNKFVEQVYGKYVSTIVDGVSNSNNSNNSNNNNNTSTNAVNEIEHNIKTSQEVACNNRTINNFGNKNNTNSVVTQLMLEDETQKVDIKIETSKGSILIPSCALESIDERTPRRVHTVCQSEQISSIKELYAKRANPNLTTKQLNNAMSLQKEEQFTRNDKETNHYLLHHLQTLQGTNKNEGRTPLKHKTKRAIRKEPYNLMYEHDKVHTILTKETASSLNANCKPGLVQLEKMAAGELQRTELYASTEEQENNKKFTRKGGKHKSGNHHMKFDYNILEKEQQQSELHPQQHCQQHTQECTPLHSRFMTRKMRSLSAHENKFEMKLNDLREAHTQRLQLLDSQPREESIMQTSHCASYSRHTAPSVASDHSELARSAKRNLQRVSRRIFSPDSKEQKDLLEYEELGQWEKKQTDESSKKLSYFERNQFQHRLRSSSSHTSRSADSLARHRNKLPFSSNNNARRSVSLLEHYYQEEKEETLSREEELLLVMPESRESRQSLSQLEETSSKKARGLWSFLHKQSFLPGANALVARRSAMLRSTSLQPYCNNGFNRRQPHRRGSSPALNANFDDTIQQEEEEHTNKTNEEFEQERANEIAGMNMQERENMKNRGSKTNSLQYDDNTLYVSHPEVDNHQINLENNTCGHVQYRMERVERTATATPTSVLVPHGPPRLSSDYNDSDDDNVNTFNDDDNDDNNDDDNSNNYNNSDFYNKKYYAENVEAVLQNNINKEEVVEEEQLRKRRDYKNSTEDTIFINKKMELSNKNGNIGSNASVSAADSKEFCDIAVTYENECASSTSPFIDNMEVQLEENLLNNDENEWTDTPLSQKGIREASKAPTLPYTKSPSREYGSDDLFHSPYSYQNACLHNKESSEMNKSQLSNSNNSDAEYVAYEPNNIQISLFNEEGTVSVV